MRVVPSIRSTTAVRVSTVAQSSGSRQVTRCPCRAARARVASIAGMPTTEATTTQPFAWAKP